MNFTAALEVASRDQAGPATRFMAPVVANGKVFVAADGEIDVYGLFQPPPPPTSDVSLISAALTTDSQSVVVSYSISEAALTSPVTIDLYWASEPELAGEIGTPYEVQTELSIGSYTTTVAIASLGQPPAQASTILAVADSPAADPNHGFVSVALPSPSPPPPPTPPPPPPPPPPVEGTLRTRTVLTAAPRPATLGRLVILTATVKDRSHRGETPVGSVTFLVGTAVLETVALRHGKARIATRSLHAGRNMITVEYVPAGPFRPSAAADRGDRPTA